MSRCNRLFWLLAMVVVVTRPSPIMAQTKKPIVAVFTIEDKGARLKKKLRERLSDYLAMTLAATGKYRVVPRDQLKKRLVQQKRRSYKKCFDQSCQIEIGKELAAQKSLSTVIMKLGSKCMVTSVLYNLRTAASEGGATAEGGCSEDAIVASIKTVVKKLVPGGKAPAPPARKPVRSAGKGGLLIKSTPGGASVTIDGQEQGGKTPLTVRDMPAGEHVLEVRKGLFRGRQKVKVVANRFVRVTVAMQKVKGQIEVLSTPPEAKVLLDGKEVGSTPMVIEAVEAGRHVVEIRKRGHVAVRREVILGVEDVKKSVNATLRHTGVISVATDPAGAVVSVDGKAAGQSPLKIELAPGAHKIHLWQKGREPLTREVTVVSGRTSEVSVRLAYTAAERTRLAGEAAREKVARARAEEHRRQAKVLASRRRGKSIWAWSSLGVGAALALTAAILYGDGASRGGGAHDSYMTTTDQDEILGYRGDIKQARTELAVGHVLAGAALAAVGFSVYHFITRPSGVEGQVSNAAPSPVGVVPAAGGATVILGGSF